MKSALFAQNFDISIYLASTLHNACVASALIDNPFALKALKTNRDVFIFFFHLTFDALRIQTLLTLSKAADR